GDLAALATFGPYTGHHHQYDRLSLVVWPFSKDAGSPLYALPARKAWYPHSYAHNTLVVDGQSHAPSGGELSSWDGHKLAISAPDAYPGIRFERSIEMVNAKIHDQLWVEAGERHTFDWLFHVDGVVSPSCNMRQIDQPLSEEGPAALITLNGEQVVQAEVTFLIKHSQNRYQLTLRGEDPFTLLIGTCPGTSRTPTSRRTIIIGRTIGTKQRYSTEIKQIL
ncbi:MAG: heparinase II/III family protein, partial [Chloroflexota bacterium]